MHLSTSDHLISRVCTTVTSMHSQQLCSVKVKVDRLLICASPDFFNGASEPGHFDADTSSDTQLDMSSWLQSRRRHDSAGGPIHRTKAAFSQIIFLFSLVILVLVFDPLSFVHQHADLREDPNGQDHHP